MLPARAKFSWRLTTVLVAAILAVYAFEAYRPFRKISPPAHADEAAYLQYAKQMRVTGYSYEGDRNRMPFYPFLLSFVYRAGMSDTDFLTAARIFSINLTTVLLLGLFFIFRTAFPPFYRIALLSISAFGVFVYRAGFVNVEPLFFFVGFAAFVLLVRMLVAPTFGLAILTGAVCGIAFLTKASALAALPFWFVIAVSQSVDRAREADSFSFIRHLAMPVVVVVTFVISVWPYISTSKQRYGEFFYNVNSAHYMWCDSWPEALSYSNQLRTPKTRAAAIEELPSAQRYWRTHSVSQMMARMLDGLASLSKRSLKFVGYYKFLLLLALAAAILIVKHRKIFRERIGRNRAAATFVVLYVIVYTLLYAWYGAVVTDSRFVLTLFLPMIFSLSVVIIKLGQQQTIALARREIPIATLVAMILIALALIDVAYNAVRIVQG